MKYLIYLTVLTAVFSFIPVKSNPPDPNKKYKVTIEKTIQEWQAVIQALGQSDRLSAAFANTLTQSIADQLNQEISQDQKKEDSLNKSLQPNRDSLTHKQPNTKK